VAAYSGGVSSSNHDRRCIKGSPSSSASELWVSQESASFSSIWPHISDYYIDLISHAAQQRYGVIGLEQYVVVIARLANHQPGSPLPYPWVHPIVNGGQCQPDLMLFVQLPDNLYCTASQLFWPRCLFDRFRNNGLFNSKGCNACRCASCVTQLVGLVIIMQRNQPGRWNFLSLVWWLYFGAISLC